jgi:hypothetical protein
MVNNFHEQLFNIAVATVVVAVLVVAVVTVDLQRRVV